MSDSGKKMLTLNHWKYLLLLILPIQNVLGDDKWYEAADGSNYLINAEYKYNWYDSSVECASRGLSLVTITTEEKNTALIDVLKKTGKDHYWIGGVGTKSSGKLRFYWIVTGEEFDYTYWWTGEPNGNGIENCVHIDGWDYHWNDNNCETNLFALVCEESSQSIQLQKYIEDLEKYLDGLVAKFGDYGS